MTEPSSTSIITLHFVAEGDVRPGAGTAAKSPRPRLSRCDFDDEGLPRMTGGDNDHSVDNGARDEDDSADLRSQSAEAMCSGYSVRRFRS